MCLETQNELNPIEGECVVCAVFNNPQLLDEYLNTYGQSFMYHCLLRSCDEGNKDFISVIVNKPHEYVKDYIMDAIDYCHHNITSETSGYINMFLFLIGNSPKQVIEEYFIELCDKRDDGSIINILLNTYGMPTEVALKKMEETEDNFINNIQVNCSCGLDHNQFTKDVLKYNQMIEKCLEINDYDLSLMTPRLKRFIEDKSLNAKGQIKQMTQMVAKDVQ